MPNSLLDYLLSGWYGALLRAVVGLRKASTGESLKLKETGMATCRWSSDSQPRSVAPAAAGFKAGLVPAVAGLLFLLGGTLVGGALGNAQPIPAGVAYLAGSQGTDGSWQSGEVRGVLATTEALRALQAVNQGPAV